MSQPSLTTESTEKAKQRIERRAPRPSSSQPVQGRPNPILLLQRSLGNRRVAQLIQTQRLTPEDKIIGLQRKLTVGATDDQFEQKADSVASPVVTMPDPVARVSLQQTSKGEGERGETKTSSPRIQRYPVPGRVLSR